MHIAILPVRAVICMWYSWICAATVCFHKLTHKTQYKRQTKCNSFTRCIYGWVLVSSTRHLQQGLSWTFLKCLQLWLWCQRHKLCCVLLFVFLLVELKRWVTPEIGFKGYLVLLQVPQSTSCNFCKFRIQCWLIPVQQSSTAAIKNTLVSRCIFGFSLLMEFVN